MVLRNELIPFASNIQFIHQLRHLGITYFLKLPACNLPQGAGDIGFAATSGTTQDNMPAFFDISAGCKTMPLHFTQLPLKKVFYLFHAVIRHGEAVTTASR